MGAPKWMQDVADTFVPDMSGRKKAAAEAAKAKAEAEAAKKQAAEDAEKAAAKKKVSEIAFRKGGVVGSASKRADGIATKGKTRGRIY